MSVCTKVTGFLERHEVGKEGGRGSGLSKNCVSRTGFDGSPPEGLTSLIVIREEGVIAMS